jgi:aminopeptidase-like protein
MNNLQEIESYFDRLWPICRSITGNGLRKSLEILQEIIPLTIHEVPSGSEVFDWIVPDEWNISDAYIICPNGKKICDIKVNNLHVVNYSVAVDQKMSFDELLPHLHIVQGQPDAIPYITSYYKKTWGFCLSKKELETLPREGQYEVFIDSTLKPGSMSYGECILKGESEEEILFSTYLCHPSMANNELSGPLATAFIYKTLLEKIPNPRFTYRFIFIPETIGAIAFLHKNGDHLKRTLTAGFVMTCCGDPGNITYKLSKRKDSKGDRAAQHILKQGINHTIIPFSVGGSDERQFCSPGFNLPVGSIIRTPYQKYKEYHTSLDNKSFISFEHLLDTVDVSVQIAQALEMNKVYTNTIPYCEPQLGKRGLYPSSASPEFNREHLHRLLHFLSYADGVNDLIEIAETRGDCVLEYSDIIQQCITAKLI